MSKIKCILCFFFLMGLNVSCISIDQITDTNSAGEPVVFYGSKKYSQKEKRFTIKFSQAVELLEIGIEKKGWKEAWRLKASSFTHFAIVGDYYFFTRGVDMVKLQPEFIYTGFYINGYTGKIEYWNDPKPLDKYDIKYLKGRTIK